MLKKILICLYLMVFCLVLAGCQKNTFPASFEIDQIEVIQIAGVDRCEDDPSVIEVTFMSASQRKTSTETGGGDQVVDIISQKGQTVFDAKRKLKAHSDKVMLLGHIDYFIIGEEAAKDDFVKYFDCFSRDSEIRFTPKIYIAKDCTAKELMQLSSTGDRFLADRLENIEYDVELMSNFEQVTLVEVAGMLDDRTEAAVIPALCCKDVKDEIYSGEMPEKDVVPAGYAVLKDFMLIGYLEDPIARGYNFLKNHVVSANFIVQDSTGLHVDLEVTSSEISIKPYFNGDTLERVQYQVSAKATVREQQSRENIYTASALKAMETQLSGVIKDEMLMAVNKSKELETDCIGLGQEIKMLHPVKWDKLKSSWSETFMNLTIDVEVESQIRRSLSIEQPNGYQKER